MNTLRLTFDPEADALYIRVVDQGERAFGQTTVNENGVAIDVDDEGDPIGYEFLSVKFSGVKLDALPAPIVKAVTDFVASGGLESTQYVVRHLQ
jgi:uncharacterized protein YuzE